MKSFKEFETTQISEVSIKEEGRMFEEHRKVNDLAKDVQASIQNLKLDILYVSKNKEDVIEDIDWVLKTIPKLTKQLQKFKKVVSKVKQ